MKYILWQHFLIVLFSLTVQIKLPASTVKQTQLHTEAIWNQGEIGHVILYPVAKHTTGQARLIDPNGKIRSEIPMFRFTFSKKRGSKTILISLFGLGPELPKGTYSIVVSTKKNSKSQFWKTEITLEPQSYAQRTIHFQSEKSKITSEITEERREQAHRFYKVLSTYNHKNIFSTDSLEWPVKQTWKVSSQFGEKRTFVFPSGKRTYDFHDGYDLANLPIGTPIYAAASGKVALAEHRIVTGNTIIIEHLPGTFTLYYHLNDLKVKTGDKVSSKTLIGHLGQTGFCTGPHLHFAVHVNGSSVDPQILINNPLLNTKWILEFIKKVENPRKNKKTKSL